MQIFPEFCKPGPNIRKYICGGNCNSVIHIRVCSDFNAYKTSFVVKQR